MRENERSRDVYERIGAYQQPPLPPLPAPGDYSTLREAGIETGGVADRLISAAFALTGYRSFERQLPQNIEGLLRRHNLRLPGVYAPVISATLALADDPRPRDLVERAATLIIAACALRDDVFAGRLPPDTHRGQPLEMGQYPNVFSTNIVVNERGARVFKSAILDRLQIMVAGRLYALTLRNPAGQLRIEELIPALRAVVGRGQSRQLEEADAPVGLLTAATAPTQRGAFSALRRAPAGAAALERTRHALMTVCFDLETQPADAAEAALMAHARWPENRWFHSSLQLVIFGNGKAAALCNFSTYLDGNTMMRVASELQKRALSCESGPRMEGAAALPEPEEIDFPCPPGLRPFIEAARRDWEAVQDRENKQATFTIAGAGRQLLTGPGVEPVPAFVAALAITARQLTGRHPPITQFFTMSRYRCMDMVTGVVTTPEVERFADAMLDDRGTRDEKRALLVAAVASQQDAGRAARRAIPLTTLMGLYIRETPGWRKRFAIAAQMSMGAALRAMGRVKPAGREILVSHPEIYAGVPVVGRPGVRLPYVSCFGLHYQIWDDETVVTMMPGLGWKTPNAELIGLLKSNLKKTQALL
jgi:hypothetical protein